MNDVPDELIEAYLRLAQPPLKARVLLVNQLSISKLIVERLRAVDNPVRILHGVEHFRAAIEPNAKGVQDAQVARVDHREHLLEAQGLVPVLISTGQEHLHLELVDELVLGPLEPEGIEQRRQLLDGDLFLVLCLHSVEDHAELAPAELFERASRLRRFRDLCQHAQALVAVRLLPVLDTARDLLLDLLAKVGLLPDPVRVRGARPAGEVAAVEEHRAAQRDAAEVAQQARRVVLLALDFVVRAQPHISHVPYTSLNLGTTNAQELPRLGAEAAELNSMESPEQ